MNNTPAANTSLKNGTDLSMILSKAEGIAWCSAFILACLFIVVGNLITIVLFVKSKTLRKKSLLLIFNMAFADLMLGVLSLPLYIYETGALYELWTGGYSRTMFLSTFFTIADSIFVDASLVSAAMISSERFYAIYWPFKHKTLSMRAYRIIVFVVWTLALLDTAVYFGLRGWISLKSAMLAWIPIALSLTFIICGCNIAIWVKFQKESVASQQQNRASQNKRLTKTLLFLSILALLSWFPITFLNFLIYVHNFQIPWRFYDLVSVVNYSNSFVNPVVYALRIPEFKKALTLCWYKGQTTMNVERIERRNIRVVSLMPAMAQLDSSIEPVLEQDVMGHGSSGEI